MKYIQNFKTTLVCTAMLAALTGNANAGAGVMFGISHNFGGETGFTFKLLTTDRKDEFAGVVGVSYFPWAPTRS